MTLTINRKKAVVDEAKNKVDAAIQAHSQWFVRLRLAIERGTSEFNPEVVKTDDSCELGKWLYSDFPSQQRGTSLYNEIKSFHAEFHARAAKVLLLAINNKKVEAVKALDTDSDIRKISSKLIDKLRELKNNL